MKIPALLTALALPAIAGEPALTIYNKNFAVVRDTVALDLKKGVNEVTYAGATLHLEPDSVILRDRSGSAGLQILEQSYRGDVLSQGLLLDLFEGETIDFLTELEDGSEKRVKGKVIRSGYTSAHGRRNGMSGSPIIEVAGELRFSLPGQPIFPALGEGTILEPTLNWQLWAGRAGKLDAELSYLTGGMSWNAAYNLVMPEKGSTMDIVGWVTVDNLSGTTFEDAVLKLIAGDVNKVQQAGDGMMRMASESAIDPFGSAPQVQQKAFDEFHLYTMPRKVTLRDRETKQIEFLRAEGVKCKTLYVYNGAEIPPHYRRWSSERIRNERDFGTESNRKVRVYREFTNTEENGLGLPMPAGVTRFYREDEADGRPEFTGENTIEHTPQGEDVRVYTGDSFDLVGERTRSDYQLDNARREMFETFEITLRNRKKEAVEIQVAEQLYRWVNWELVEKSDEFTKVDARNIRFTVKLKPDEERKITYRVRYWW